jgi:hypothetical protein
MIAAAVAAAPLGIVVQYKGKLTPGTLAMPNKYDNSRMNDC